MDEVTVSERMASDVKAFPTLAVWRCDKCYQILARVVFAEGNPYLFLPSRRLGVARKTASFLEESTMEPRWAGDQEYEEWVHRMAAELRSENPFGFAARASLLFGPSEADQEMSYPVFARCPTCNIRKDANLTQQHEDYKWTFRLTVGPL